MAQVIHLNYHPLLSDGNSEHSLHSMRSTRVSSGGGGGEKKGEERDLVYLGIRCWRARGGKTNTKSCA